jgi:hypothetical protein
VVGTAAIDAMDWARSPPARLSKRPDNSKKDLIESEYLIRRINATIKSARR